MLDRWTMAPWMRRRLARHVRRGTSNRMIACLINPAPGSVSESVAPAAQRAEITVEYDLSNVILFRALAANRAGAGRAAR
jgi:hypothetical protein